MKAFVQIAVENENGSMFIDLCSMIKQIADYIIPDRNPYAERIGEIQILLTVETIIEMMKE